MSAIAADMRARHRQMRGAWALLLAGLWMIFWWLRLDSERRAALAIGCNDNFVNKMSDMVIGAGETCKASINGNFWGGMFLFALLSPLALVVAHHIAKWRIDSMAAAEQRAASHKEQARQQAHAAAISDMGAKARHEEQASRTTNDRYELITRLGAVDDQLIVLADEPDPERVKLIQMNIMQSVRDIHAKFRDEELRAMHAADSGIASRVARTLAEMRKLKLEGTRLYDDLASLFQPDSGEAPSIGSAVAN